LDWEAAAAFIAAIALFHSLWQARRVDRERERADRMKFLLGEKETVAFEAGRIAQGAEISSEMIQALVLAALFENSDRARLQVYRALDSLPEPQKAVVVAALDADMRAAEKYRDGLDLRSFTTRRGQLQAALPWTDRAQTAEGSSSA
jgi:hypothetical protein